MTEKENSLKLLLLSDIHCTGAGRGALGHFFGDTKRKEHVQEQLKTLLDRFWGRADYVVIAGDFTHNGKPEQYDAVRVVLDQYDPNWFYIIPGNHDTGNFNNLESWNTRMRRFKQKLGAYLPASGAPLPSKEYFPYVRELAPGFALIGLDSTLARTALGRVGKRQLEQLRRFLADTEHRDKHKIILLHHDVTGDTKLFNGFEMHYGNVMTDKDEFMEIVGEHAHPGGGAVTVISGHTHIMRVDTHTIPGATFFNVPSLGSQFERDCIFVELFSNGAFRELETDTAPARTRRLKKLGKILLPRIHT